MAHPIGRALNVDDLRRLARRRLPRIIFDHIEGGLDDEAGVERNAAAFAAYELMPQYLVDVSRPDRRTTLFGRTYASPFGIAPTGLAGLAWHRGDLALAETARDADVPFVISGHSTVSLEALAAAAGGNAWFQLYIARDSTVSEDLCRRAADAGIETLVVTVDVPVHGKRERNIRNGFVRPYRPSRSAMIEALCHPGWLATVLRHGMPTFENWAPYARPGAAAMEVADYVSSQMPSVQTWRQFEDIRHWWRGNLVVKGILHPADARRAVTLGADGIVVSNHGGRQLDRAPASVRAFPAVAAAVGGSTTLMLDSGVRRGADIVIALCLGARFVFVGRATLYGLAAGGAKGARRAIDILYGEVGVVMAQLGRPSIDDLCSEALFDSAGPVAPLMPRIPFDAIPHGRLT